MAHIKFESNNFHDKTEFNQLDGLSKTRQAIYTGLLTLPDGVKEAARYEWRHPAHVAKTLADSALCGAALKTILPTKGPAGLIVGLAAGSLLTASSMQPIWRSMQKAHNAKNQGELEYQGEQIGKEGGKLLVESVIYSGGYKSSHKATDHILLAEKLDKFADIKNNIWHAIDSGLVNLESRAKNKLGIPNDAFTLIPNVHLMQSRFEIVGDRANMLTSKYPEQTANLKGETDLHKTMLVTIMLKSKGSDHLMDRHLERIAKGRVPSLKDNEFERKFGVDYFAFSRMINFAGEHKLEVKEFDPASGRIVLKGTAGQFCNAFRVKLSDHETHDGQIFLAKSDNIYVPVSIAKDIEGIFGLDQRPIVHANIRSNKPKFIASYLPNQVADAYKFPKNTSGNNQGIGIVEFGGGLDLKDNAKYYKQHGLPEPRINLVSIDGAKNNPGYSADDGEVALDSQVVGAVAPGAEQMIVFAPNTDQGFVDAIERATFTKKGETPNSALSISWGGPENTWSEQTVHNVNLAFKKAALKGISVFAASGDDGAVDKSPDGSFQVDYPASDPLVTGCGGTKLELLGNEIVNEVAWNDGKNGGAGGGGISELFSVPFFQYKVKLPDNANGHGISGRGVPDIAGNASELTGWKVRVNGQERTFGGTSAVAPLYAALIARVNEKLSYRVGFLNPILYANKNTNLFNDIVQGHNGGYKAGKGWDAVTGLGSINGEKLLDILSKDIKL